MTIASREPEAVEADTGSRRNRRRAAERGRLKVFLQVLSVLAAFAGAFFLLFAGEVVGVQDAIEDVIPPAIEDPTPSEATPGSPSEAVPGFDAGELEDRLGEIAEGHQGIYGVAVLDPGSRTSVSLRGDEEFVAASIGKLPPFAALYRAAARGELDLDETISIQKDDFQSYGSGSLHALPAGYSLSLRDVAYYLVNHSDNTAWAMLDRRLGEDSIREELESMGVQDSRYEGHSSGYYTTPDDVLLLMEKISDPDFTDEELSEEMIDAMTETVFEDRIPEKLPSDVRVSHKIGSYGNNFGDAGVVFYKDQQGVEKHYYIVVLSSGAGEYEARDAIQEMSLAVYEALTGTQVDPEWSRGVVDTGPENNTEAPPAAPPKAPTPPPAAPEPTPPPAPQTAQKAAPVPPTKAPPQEKASPKVAQQAPARYDASSYPSPKYGTYSGQGTRSLEDYYYYEAPPEEDSYYWEQY